MSQANSFENTTRRNIFNGISIRAKLFSINAILLIGIISYALFEHHSLSNMDELKLVSIENTKAEIDLLMLRRHEKDYLARQESKYQTRFGQTYTELSNRLTSLELRIKNQ